MSTVGRKRVSNAQSIKCTVLLLYSISTKQTFTTVQTLSDHYLWKSQFTAGLTLQPVIFILKNKGILTTWHLSSVIVN